jgi:hypothetical protein
MLRRVALVRTDVSKERIASIMRVTRIGDPGTTLAVTINRSIMVNVPWLTVTVKVSISPILLNLVMEEIRPFGMSVLTRVTRRNVPEGDIIHSPCCENQKYYK